MMEDNQEIPQNQETEDKEIHRGQLWFDNIFLLLALSILITGLIYNVWGLLELFAR